jgi:glycerophosphoryl diester phosphodiesterase
MERLDGGSAVPERFRGGIVALGNFDGFHRGHQAVVGRAVERGRAEGRPVLVATFDPHPVRFFKPDVPPFRLTSLNQRERLFGEAGADAMLVFHFDAALAAVTAEEFVADRLVGLIGAAGAVTGEDFTFGRGRRGTIETLERLGVEQGLTVDSVAPVEADGAPVSSSRIREALQAGDCEGAAALLTRPFAIEGVVEPGDQRGRAIGYPTANLQLGTYWRRQSRHPTDLRAAARIARALFFRFRRRSLRPEDRGRAHIVHPAGGEVRQHRGNAGANGGGLRGGTEEIGKGMRFSRWQKIGLGFAIALTALSLWNASWLAPKPKGRLMLVAHRGVAQQFDREGVDNDTCTATRIRKSDHKFIENTIPSMAVAIERGANAIELDVHPTKDGEMVVFHDWTLDCRTNGTGVVREKNWAELEGLDVGYGYSWDGGRTYPLRGRGIGQMPTLGEVLKTFPTLPLVINFKSKDPRDADVLLAAFARAGKRIDGKYSFYGHPAVTGRLRQRVPGAWTWYKDGMKACLKDYLKLGWTGYVPGSCRNTTVAVPLNYQWAIWGWPNRFLDRMAKVNTHVIMLGPYEDSEIAGIDQPEQLGEVPRDFRGYVWVEDIYTVGPALQR